MTVLKNGAWTQSTADAIHQSSPSLAKWLINYLPKHEHVIDFGCGNAYYLSKLSQAGFNGTGVEGFKLNNFLFKNVIVKDLTKSFDLGAKGSVMCLEVIEHIDKQFEQILLDTITNHCTEHLIFSWALIGQPGVSHVNCADQSYAISEIERRGFTYLPIQTQECRDIIDENTSWFRRTMLIFKKNG